MEPSNLDTSVSSNQHKRLDGDDPRIERILRATEFVPLGLYDEIAKLAEYAVGEIIEEHNSLLEQLEAAHRLLIDLINWSPQTQRGREAMHPQHRAALEAAEVLVATPNPAKRPE